MSEGENERLEALGGDIGVQMIASRALRAVNPSLGAGIPPITRERNIAPVDLTYGNRTNMILSATLVDQASREGEEFSSGVLRASAPPARSERIGVLSSAPLSLVSSKGVASSSAASRVRSGEGGLKSNSDPLPVRVSKRRRKLTERMQESQVMESMVPSLTTGALPSTKSNSPPISSALSSSSSPSPQKTGLSMLLQVLEDKGPSKREEDDGTASGDHTLDEEWSDFARGAQGPLRHSQGWSPEHGQPRPASQQHQQQLPSKRSRSRRRSSKSSSHRREASSSSTSSPSSRVPVHTLNDIVDGRRGRHRSRDTPPKYNCRECSEGFNHRQDLSDHVITRHRGLVFVCADPYCTHVFERTNTRNSHLRRKHGLVGGNAAFDEDVRPSRAVPTQCLPWDASYDKEIAAANPIVKYVKK